MGKPRRQHRGTTPPIESGRYRVFVSHATADKWLAKTLCEKIEQSGAATFRDDRDIDGGDDIPARIRQEIIRSNEMVVLLTPDSIGRPWVLLEVGAAWGRRQRSRITAVLCHVGVDTIPDMIASKKAIPINDLDDYLRELRRRVERHVP
ncbi:MAG: toll/interleukin-1 receptor domain-containing protein [Pirellulales bacterium]|nr:toll/interleukin-1 receptor domain-containing protein [Pirellulales bacterium]